MGKEDKIQSPHETAKESMRFHDSSEQDPVLELKLDMAELQAVNPDDWKELRSPEELNAIFPDFDDEPESLSSDDI